MPFDHIVKILIEMLRLAKSCWLSDVISNLGGWRDHFSELSSFSGRGGKFEKLRSGVIGLLYQQLKCSTNEPNTVV